MVDPIYREDGKVMKGPNYFKPNISKITKLELLLSSPKGSSEILYCISFNFFLKKG